MATPPPPQVWGETQLSAQVPPQPFGPPHLPPQLGAHPQTLLAPQVCGAVQLPQVNLPPQPSSTLPQLSPAGQLVLLVQPQTFGLPGFPPPQVCGAVHPGPQLIEPQPAIGGVYWPQSSPAGHVVGQGKTPVPLRKVDAVAPWPSFSPSVADSLAAAVGRKSTVTVHVLEPFAPSCLPLHPSPVT